MGISYSLRLQFTKFKPQLAGNASTAAKKGPQFVAQRGTPELFLSLRVMRSDEDICAQWKALQQQTAGEVLQSYFRLHASIAVGFFIYFIIPLCSFPSLPPLLIPHFLQDLNHRVQGCMCVLFMHVLTRTYLYYPVHCTALHVLIRSCAIPSRPSSTAAPATSPCATPSTSPLAPTTPCPCRPPSSLRATPPTSPP